jgi:hypothetical protein
MTDHGEAYGDDDDDDADIPPQPDWGDDDESFGDDGEEPPLPGGEDEAWVGDDGAGVGGEEYGLPPHPGAGVEDNGEGVAGLPAGWGTGVSRSSGETYYVHEATGAAGAYAGRPLCCWRACFLLPVWCRYLRGGCLGNITTRRRRACRPHAVRLADGGRPPGPTGPRGRGLAGHQGRVHGEEVQG